MLPVDDVLLDAITGSFVPYVRVDAWYNGALVKSDLPVMSGSVTVDAGSLVQRQCDLVIAGTDPQLDPDWVGPAGELSPLGCDGQELTVHLGVSLPGGFTTSVQVGRFVIDSVDPEDSWIPYRGGKSALSGIRVALSGKDRALRIQEDRFFSPMASAASTLYAEVSRLLAPLGHAGQHRVADRSIGSIVYETDDRLAALDAVAKAANARLVWDTDGAACLMPRASTGGVWALPQADRDVMVSVSRKRSRDDIYNAVSSEGADADQNPLYGQAIEQNGPYRTLGPFGRRVYKRRAPFAQTQYSADADAQTTLSNIRLSRQQEITIVCPYNPALEALDEVEWVALNGEQRRGQAQKIEMHFDGTMSLSVLSPHPVAP